MENLLLFIKHHFNIIWKFFEWGNGIVFAVLYRQRLAKSNTLALSSIHAPPFIYKRLEKSDLYELFHLIHSQTEGDLKYFNAHGFSLQSLQNQFDNPSFLMMGVYHNDHMIGYFFLRCFVNKKCFVGRLIDKLYRGKGIGEIMNKIMYETAWNMRFRCLSTISRNNKAVIQSHSRNKNMVILKNLRNNYLLIEFVQINQQIPQD